MANRNIDKKYHFLYKTTNLINSKYYYGIHSTNEIEDGYIGSGVYLTRAVRKYGKENFKREILQMFDNRDELVQAEKNLITKEMIQDKYCMNCTYGGEVWNTIGMITVKNKNGKTFKVFKDDPRYLSGELIGVTRNYFKAKDENNNIFHITKNDPRYISGELVGFSKNKINVKDRQGNGFQININDPKYLSGELSGVTKGFINVKDKDGNILKVSIYDPRYLSGELVSFWKDRQHTEDTKKKMSESSKGQCLGEKNGSYGTCWITNNNKNKKIKKDELDNYILQGWSKGRKYLNS